MIFSAQISFAQEDADVLIYGNVKDHFSRKKLEGVVVKVSQNGKSFDSQTITSSGKYEFFLPLNQLYSISFEKPGYVSKFFEVNAKNIPSEDLRGGFSMPADVSLFETMEGVDFSILNDPIGKASYQPERGGMEWDMDYTNGMLNELARLMREVEKANEEAAKEEDAAAIAAAKLEEDFKKFMADGEADMVKKAYDGAINNFTSALDLKPQDTTAKTKLAEAQKKFDDQQAALELERNYNAFIDDGDNAFRAKNWEEAIGHYQSASGLKPTEKYPKDQLKLAQDELKKLEDAAALEASVSKLIAEGDTEVEKEAYQKGIDKYNAALALISSNMEALDKLKEAQRLLAEYEAQAAQRAEYDGLIAEADKLFDSKKYAESITKYESASEVFPKEIYPKDRIAEAKDLIAQLEAAAAEAEARAAMQAQFDALMADGERALSSKDYDSAIDKFLGALELLPEDATAQKKLNDAERAKQEAENAALAQENYDKAIAEADRYFDKSEYEAAIEKYREALESKDERYPKDRLAEAEQRIKDRIAADEEAARLAAEAEAQSAIQAEFDGYMQAGRSEVQEKNFEGAIPNFESALAVIPGDQTAKAELDAAKQALEDQRSQMEAAEREAAEAAALEAIRTEFDGYMEAGRTEMKEENFEEAISDFEKALTVIPQDKSARDELDAAKQALEDQRSQMEAAEREAAEAAALAAKRAEYDDLMDKGERALMSESFEAAIKSFSDAASVLPDEASAPDRKAFAQKAFDAWRLAQSAAEQQTMFDTYMEEAREAMKNKVYQEAISNYEGALTVFADDNEAKSGIETARQAIAKQEADALAEAARLKEEAERNAAMASEKERKERFDRLLVTGDEAMSKETFGPAIDSYSEALTIFPDDNKAKSKLERAERAQQDALAKEEDKARKRAEEEARLAELEAQRALDNLAEAERRRQAEKDLAYLDAIKEADKYFAYEDFLVSKTYYEDALEIKPDEIYPKSRIERIELLLKQSEEEERLRAEQERLAREREESRGFKRGKDLSNTAEDDIDARMAEERRKSLEAKWKAMENDKESWKEVNERLKRGEGSRIDENSSLVEDYRTTSKNMATEAEKDSERRTKNMSSYKEALSGQDIKWKNRQDRNLEKSEDEITSFKEKSAQEKERYYGKSSSYADHQKSIVKLKETQEEMSKQADKDYEAKLKEQEREAAVYRTYLDKKAEMSEETLEANKEEILDLKESISRENSKAAERKNETQVSELELVRNRQKALLEIKNTESEVARKENLEEAYEANDYRAPKSYMDFDANQLVNSYPQGVTEETYNESNKAVIRRIVIVGNKAFEYHKVVSRSGTYYFKNGISISKAIWDLESDKVPE